MHRVTTIALCAALALLLFMKWAGACPNEDEFDAYAVCRQAYGTDEDHFAIYFCMQAKGFEIKQSTTVAFPGRGPLDFERKS